MEQTPIAAGPLEASVGPGEEQPYIRRRIAETLCNCALTDGFCAPHNKLDCQCWRLAKEIERWLMEPHGQAIHAGWLVTHKAYIERDKADPVAVLRAMLVARPNKEVRGA